MVSVFELAKGQKMILLQPSTSSPSTSIPCPTTNTSSAKVVGELDLPTVGMDFVLR
jgi:hypothetical protein